MKLLIVSALYHPHHVGGAEKVAQIVAEGMVEAGHEVVVATTDEGRDVHSDVVNGVKVHYIGLKNIYWPHARKNRPRLIKPLWHAIDRYNPLMAQALSAILDSEQPDVVNTHSLTGFSCAVWPVIAQRRIPLLHTLHDYSLMCPKTSMFKAGANCGAPCRVCKLYSAPSKRHSQHVDGVVGVSRHVLDRHLAQGYFDNAGTRRVIYNALPPSAHIPGVASERNQPLRVGYVGQLIPSKGIADLIATMGAWPSSQCRLVVAGKGAADYEEALRREAPDNISFLGFVDPSELYSTIDVLVVPSLWEEPLGMIVLEAYAHGVPVIAAASGGLREIVEHGNTGMVYDPSSKAGLQDAISAFVHDRSLVTRFRPRIAEKTKYFTLERMRAEYLEVFEQAQRAAAALRTGVPQ